MPSPPPASCLCGGVKLRFCDEPSIISHCFCTDCSTNASGPVQLNLAFEEATVSIEDSEKLIRTYEMPGTVSGKKKLKFFCGRCGCTLSLFTKPDHYPGEIFAKASVVDGG